MKHVGVALAGGWTQLGRQTEQKLKDVSLMKPILFWGTHLKLLWLCLSWDIPVFLSCVWIYSLNSLDMLSTFLNPTTSDCCLNINNSDAHPFYLSCVASSDICLRKFPLVAHVPLLAAWRHGVIFSVLSSCCSRSERTGKFSIKNW